jgi:hypothetical protein
MLQKFKIITCAFILFLFGFTLMTVSPVFAKGPRGGTALDELNRCDRNNPKTPYEYKAKITCFSNQAHSILLEYEKLLQTISDCVSNPVREAQAEQCVRDAVEGEGERYPISADKGPRGRGLAAGYDKCKKFMYKGKVEVWCRGAAE